VIRHSLISLRRVVSALALVAGSLHGQQTHVVQVSSNVFTPAQLTINSGDTVEWRNNGGRHNVEADDGSFRCANGCDGDGQGGNGNASTAAWVVQVTFDNAGSNPYFCEVHVGVGMTGTITVEAAPPPTASTTAATITAPGNGRLPPRHLLDLEARRSVLARGVLLR
jgi:plastocyanin